MTTDKNEIKTLKEDLANKQVELNNYCQTSAQDISALKVMLDNAYTASEFADKDKLFEQIVDAQIRMKSLMNDIITINQEIHNLSKSQNSNTMDYVFVTVLVGVALSLMESYTLIATALGAIALILLGFHNKKFVNLG